MSTPFLTLRPPVSKTSSQQVHSAIHIGQKTSGAVGDAEIVVAGSIALDLICDYDAQAAKRSGGQLKLYTSNPVVIQENIGGVGRNIATATHFLGLNTRLCTVLAHDAAGALIKARLEDQGMSTSGIRQQSGGSPTARYIALNDTSKDLFVAAADMRILTDGDWDISIDETKSWIGGSPRWTVVDANWSSYAIRCWLESAKSVGSKTAFEPVSIAKARRLFDLKADASSAGLPAVPHNIVTLATPNALELRSMWETARESGQYDRPDWFEVINAFGLTDSGSRAVLEKLTDPDLVDQGIPQQSIQLLPFIPCIAVTMGSRGVLLTQILGPDDDRLRSPAAAPYLLPSSMHTLSGAVYMRLFPPAEDVDRSDILSVNGVGDTFTGALIAGLVKSQHARVEDVVGFAQECAVLTLKNEEAVSPQLAELQGKLSSM